MVVNIEIVISLSRAALIARLSESRSGRGCVRGKRPEGSCVRR